jgi:hypothetical protein
VSGCGHRVDVRGGRDPVVFQLPPDAFLRLGGHSYMPGAFWSDRSAGRSDMRVLALRLIAAEYETGEGQEAHTLAAGKAQAKEHAN